MNDIIIAVFLGSVIGALFAVPICWFVIRPIVEWLTPFSTERDE